MVAERRPDRVGVARQAVAELPQSGVDGFHLVTRRSLRAIEPQTRSNRRATSMPPTPTATPTAQAATASAVGDDSS